MYLHLFKLYIYCLTLGGPSTSKLFYNSGFVGKTAKRGLPTNLGKKMLPLSKICFLDIPDYCMIFSGKNYYCGNGYIVLWLYIISP